VAVSIHYRISAPIALETAFEIRGFTALLGRSGAGKTTLLKALGGLLPATGTPWAGLPARDRPVGYLPQGSALFPHLTVLENAAFALRGKQRLAQARQLLDDLGVGQLAARKASEVSGGEAQRVALARALARQPELLLLDEPSAALDASTRDAVFAQLIETIDARNIPALAATHDPAIAGLADWLVLLDEGRIIAEGTPRELFNPPRTVQAAKLVGYQNFWVTDGKTCCIRAEDIEIVESGQDAIIVSVREQGADLRLICAALEPMTVLIRNGDKTRFQLGQSVRLLLPEAKIRVLNDRS
jgi:molybdate transport system ATP-binding protein